MALGLLVVGDENLPNVRKILTSLFETAKVKDSAQHSVTGVVDTLHYAHTHIIYAVVILLLLPTCLAQLKQFDLHMTVGEAISCAAAGRFSKAATDPWQAAYGHEPEAQKGEVVGEGDSVPVPGRIQENLRWTLEKIISTKYAVSSVLGQRQVRVSKGGLAHCSHFCLECFIHFVFYL